MDQVQMRRMAAAEACLRGDYGQAVAVLSSGGQVSTLPKGMDYPLYDTDYLIGPRQVLRLFSSTNYINGPVAGQQKSLADTNMEADGALPSPKTHYGLGLYVELLPDLVTGERPTAAQVADLKAETWITLIQGQRETARYNMEQLSGPAFFGIPTAAATARNIQFGADEPGMYLAFGETFVNGPNQYFAVAVNTTPDFPTFPQGTGLRIRISIPGVLQTTAA
jgi:hypothetical protein